MIGHIRVTHQVCRTTPERQSMADRPRPFGALSTSAASGNSIGAPAECVAFRTIQDDVVIVGVHSMRTTWAPSATSRATSAVSSSLQLVCLRHTHLVLTRVVPTGVNCDRLQGRVTARRTCDLSADRGYPLTHPLRDGSS
jgi:hypothetical protein